MMTAQEFYDRCSDEILEKPVSAVSSGSDGIVLVHVGGFLIEVAKVYRARSRRRVVPTPVIAATADHPAVERRGGRLHAVKPRRSEALEL